MKDENKPATEMPFQAEVQQILHLVIHSLYTNQEVFLRELVSNASDALDKARFLSLTQKDGTPQEGEPSITIRLNEEERTLTIEDNGVGMTREEVIQNLGTIAKSGTVEFLKAHAEAMKKSKDGSLIGQFGVGFYASFMVASRVDVKTRSMLPGAEPVLWRSTGTGTFSVLPGERTTPGTEIVLHMKDEAREFLKAWRVKDIIKKYSDFVHFPIHVAGEVANRSRALWTLPKGQVTEEQHEEFFHHVSGDLTGGKPLLTVHYSVDAPIQFHALLYVPDKAPFDLYTRDAPRGLRLYAKRVLIVEHCEKLTQPYLRFLRGVVDSEDLSLNVSREMLQEDRTLNQIEGQVTKQVLKALKELSENEKEKYLTFWKEFGKVIKEGLVSDWKNKDALAELLRFETMKSDEGELISLRDYVAGMPESQKEIYFVTGPTRKAVERSPHLEAFRSRGYDVLFLIDPVDEWMVQSLTEFEKKKLKSVAHGDVDLGEEKTEGSEGEPTGALEAVKKALGDKVKDVRFSKRLTDSASCLVADEGATGANMERILRSLEHEAHDSKKILEINKSHPIVKGLDTLAKRSPDSPRITLTSELLLDQALLSEGVVPNPGDLVRRIQTLLTEVSL